MHLEDYRKRKLKEKVYLRFILSDFYVHFFVYFFVECGLIKSQNINIKLIDLVLDK